MWNLNTVVLSRIVPKLISSESFTPALKYITNQMVSSSHRRLFLDGRLAGSSCLVGLRWHRALADILTTSSEAAVCMLLVFRDDPRRTKTPFYLELGPLPWGHMQNITQQHKSIIWSSTGGVSRRKIQTSIGGEANNSRSIWGRLWFKKDEAWRFLLVMGLSRKMKTNSLVTHCSKKERIREKMHTPNGE